ncbi:MAG: DJ-1/PfpI family protein [Clostridiales Family XIII bacterium]|jgi:4-methyl-5(b-hydroxyethyl)-thiazole monophosphate biosynthesis|nr:DJ-1/PfpI family protein [Clostridiales Family XIII bacterium]
MVYVHFADGFEEMEALVPVDALRRAGIETKMVSIMGRLNVRGAHDVEVASDILFEDADYDSCEMIVLPGGSEGADHLRAHEGLTKKILSFADQGKNLAAICASPAVVFGSLGILRGKRATCYPGLENEMEGAIRAEGNAVRDGNIITSRGPATAPDFAFALIEMLKGAEIKEEVAARMLY